MINFCDILSEIKDSNNFKKNYPTTDKFAEIEGSIIETIENEILKYQLINLFSKANSITP